MSDKPVNNPATPGQGPQAAGMALVLICLLVEEGTHHYYLTVAIVLLAVNMTVPAAYAPFARVWFSLSHLLGEISTRIVLTLVFFGVVTPLALLRRLLGKKPMADQWKKGTGSLLIERNHLFAPEDLKNPY